MKHLTTVLFLMTALSLMGQSDYDIKSIHAGVAGGYYHGPAYEAQLGYSTGRLAAIIGVISPASPSTKGVAAIYFKPAYGVPIGSAGVLEVAAGYCYHVHKLQAPEGDWYNPGLANTGVIFSIYYLRWMGDACQLFVGGNKSRIVTSAVAGVRVTMFKLN